VGDKEHAEIIKLYVDEGLSMNKIGEKLGRSSRVPYKHIHQHNASVEGAGFCPACRRVKSGFYKTLARRDYSKNE
jgi:transposase-like protein